MTTGTGRRLLLPALVTVLGLGAVGLAQGVPNRQVIEDDLTARSERALAAAGLSTVDVRFVGRDGRLRAATRADADRAVQIVRAQEGVRVARAEVVADATTPDGNTSAAKTPPSVNASLDGGRVVLTGTVASDAARTALANAISGTVDNRLTVSTEVSDAGLAGFGDVVNALGKDTRTATVELRDGKLTLTGTVLTEAARQAAVRAASNAVGNPSAVTDRLTVAPSATGSQVQAELAALAPITFASGSAELTADGQATVARVAEILRANPGVRVRIEGHTDGNGTEANNLALSQARAQTVLAAVAALGIAADRLTAAGLGETRPRVPNDSPTNLAANRRVEFIVV